MMNQFVQHWRQWVILLIISVTGGIGLCQIEPVGHKVGVIQFDSVIKLNTDNITWSNGLFFANDVWFVRYWVCQDFYAVSVVWNEPRSSIETLAILSDKNGFRISNDKFPFWVPTNKTYPKPLGEMGPLPFRDQGSVYDVSGIRFAEAEARARRVYTTDLKSLTASGNSADAIIDLKPGENPHGVKRKLAHLKVRTKAGRIESMDLLDKARRKLVGIKYQYSDGKSPAISRLVADLPVRPEKLLVDTNGIVDTGNAKIPWRVADMNYVSHKGGRTCTVTYRTVKAGGMTLRLPVLVRVQRRDNKRLVRSATLMNFKRVNLDEAAVWKAARAFAGFSPQDRKVIIEIYRKFIMHLPKLGPRKVDPNDLAFVHCLIAKYPIPKMDPATSRPPTGQGSKNAVSMLPPPPTDNDRAQ